MEIVCPQCNTSLAVQGDSPKFCSECGGSLSTSQPIPMVAREDVDATIAPANDLTDFGGDATIARSGGVSGAGATELNNDSVGPYRLIRPLGQGGMGTVYEAVHEKTGQTVALKLLQRSLLSTDEAVERFKRESRIAASISHPRSTFVYEANQHNGQFYITMELMSGGSLKEVVAEEGPLPVGRAVDYILDVIDGLQVAHQAGIVHRDLKPANCFIDHDGRVKIGDFGLAKSFFSDSSLTQTGMFMGTPQFAAPEQLRADVVDERTDIYALGATLFYLLSGEAPFQGGAAQVIASIASETPRSISSVVENVPRDLERAIAQTMEKQPARRQQNLSELRAALSPFSTRGASLADGGRRMAAYFIDLMLAGFIAGMVGQLVVFSTFVMGQTPGDMKSMQLVSFVSQFITLVYYFAFAENRYGRAAGKWLMGMRVVGTDSENPHLLNSLLRAAMIPGLSWMVNSIGMMSANISPEMLTNSIQGVIQFMATIQVVAILSWIPVLLVMSTARASNGFRGFHEIVSKTRVVRLGGELESKRVEDVPVTAPLAISEKPNIGGAEAIGGLAEFAGVKIYAAHDPILHREVWLFDGPSGVGKFQGDRKSVNRPARLRILTSTTTDRGVCHATEAVRGVPLIDLIQSRDVEWRSLLPVFQELLGEIDFSLAENTLPSILEPDQVWVDGSGRLKLVDLPIRHASAEASGGKGNVDPNPHARALRLVRFLLERCCELINVPVHVINLKDEIQSRDANDETVDWVIGELSEFADRPSTWNWDDRLGLVAVAFGVQSPAYICYALFVGLLVTNLFNSAPIAAALATFAAISLLTFALGFFFRGGIAIRLSDVSVRAGSKAAGAIRCGFREMLSWIPFAIVTGIFLCVVLFQIRDEQASIQGHQTQIAYMLLCTIPIFLVWFFSLVLALIWPSRGSVDLLTGTSLRRN